MNRKYFFIIVFLLFLLIPQKCYAYDFIDAEHTPDNILCYSSRYDYSNRQKYIQLLFLTDSPDDKYLSTHDNVSFYAIYKGQEIKEHGTNNLYYLLGVCDVDSKKSINCHKVHYYGVNNIKYDYNSLGNYFQSFSKETLKNNPEIFVDHYYVQLVSNPEFAPNVRVFESVSDFQEFVANDGLDNPILPDNPPVETGNPKITLSSGEYYLIDTNKKICGVLNADSEYYFYNKQKTDIELFLIDTDYNDNKFILNTENVTAVKYSSTGQYIEEQEVKLVTINRNCKSFLLRTYLKNNTNFVHHNYCLSIDKAATYSDFSLVAPSQPALLRYLLNDLNDGEDDTFPVFPVIEEEPEPEEPTDFEIPAEWGFIGVLFNAYIGKTNSLLNSIKSDIKSLISDVGEGFDSLLSIASGIKESVLDALGSLAGEIGDSVSSGVSNVLTDLFVPADGYIDSHITNLRQNFSFVDSIYTAGNTVITSLNTISGNTSPEIIVHLSSKTFGASYGQKDVVINFEWYKPYKNTVDFLLSSILWVAYIWLLYKRIPEIIRGNGMISESVFKYSKKG